MKRVLLLGLLAVVTAAFSVSGCGNSGAPTAPAGAQIITIPPNAAGTGSAAYGTNPLHVPAGTKVAWLNSDTMAHTATTTGTPPASFDTGSISPGNYSSVVTISTAGTYSYYCTIHGQSSMNGQIISP